MPPKVPPPGQIRLNFQNGGLALSRPAPNEATPRGPPAQLDADHPNPGRTAAPASSRPAAVGRALLARAVQRWLGGAPEEPPRAAPGGAASAPSAAAAGEGAIDWDSELAAALRGDEEVGADVATTRQLALTSTGGADSLGAEAARPAAACGDSDAPEERPGGGGGGGADTTASGLVHAQLLPASEEPGDGPGFDGDSDATSEELDLYNLDWAAEEERQPGAPAGGGADTPRVGAGGARVAAADTAGADAARPRIGSVGVGMVNLGYSCFGIAVLQCFFRLEGFELVHDDLRLVAAYNMLQLQWRTGRAPVSREEMRAFWDAVVGDRTAHDYDVRRARLTGYAQQDATEFMSIVLLASDASGASTLAFTVRRACQRRAPAGVDPLAAGLYTERDDPCKVLTLEIVGRTLQSCLEHLTAVEAMDGPARDNLLEFETANGTLFVGGSRRFTLATTPPYLVVSLKRFLFDVPTRRRRKLDAPVRVPALLDLSPYCTAPTSGSVPDPRDGSRHYELISVVAHAGDVEVGHYIALARGADGQWRVSDDDTVRETDIASVLRLAEGTGAEGSTSAYLLFYARVEQPAAAALATQVLSSGGAGPSPAPSAVSAPSAAAAREGAIDWEAETMASLAALEADGATLASDGDDERKSFDDSDSVCVEEDVGTVHPLAQHTHTHT